MSLIGVQASIALQIHTLTQERDRARLTAATYANRAHAAERRLDQAERLLMCAANRHVSHAEEAATDRLIGEFLAQGSQHE